MIFKNAYFKDNKPLLFIKGGVSTQTDCAMLNVKKSAKNCTNFLPFCENNFNNARSILLDVKYFSKEINIDKNQFGQNDLNNGYCATIKDQPEMVNYNLRTKTFDELHSRVSMKPEAVAEDLEEMFVADIQRVGIKENDIEKYNKQSDYNKLVRITILYIFKFFALVFVTFFIIYLV